MIYDIPVVGEELMQFVNEVKTKSGRDVEIYISSKAIEKVFDPSSLKENGYFSISSKEII